MLDETTIDTLKREKTALEEIMKNGRQRIKALDMLLKAYDSDAPSTNGRTPRRQPAPAQPKADGEITFRQHIVEVLKERQPLAPKDIRTALSSRGLTFNDNTVTYHLRTSHLFENTGDGKWQLTEFDDE